MNVAVVGCGYWGRNHLRILNELGVLSSACDVHPNTRHEVEHQYRINVYNDSLHMYHNEQLDAVTICTPHEQLATETLRALSHHVHVFVEKPMALSSFDAWKIWAASQETNCMVMPGLIEYFNPKVEQFKHTVCLQFTRKNPYKEGRNLVWDTIVHDIGAAYYLEPEWALFNVAWTSGWTKREINGQSTICSGSLDRELQHFVNCVRDVEVPKMTVMDGVRVVEIAEQIQNLSTQPG